MARGRRQAASLALLLSVRTACADTLPWMASRIRDAPPPRAAKALPDIRPSIDRARRCMQAGDYQKAIDTYHAAYRHAPRDPMLVKSYIASPEQMAAAADQALERQAVGVAGKTYDTLLNNFARFEGHRAASSLVPHRTGAKAGILQEDAFQTGVPGLPPAGPQPLDRFVGRLSRFRSRECRHQGGAANRQVAAEKSAGGRFAGARGHPHGRSLFPERIRNTGEFQAVLPAAPRHAM